MQISEQTRHQVMTVLYRFSQAYRQNDLEAILSLHDPGFRGYGTGRDEKILGLEGVKRQYEQEFARGDRIAFEYLDTRIGAEGTIAWVMSDVALYVTTGGAPKSVCGRLTMVLRGTGHSWVIAQSHLSVPAA